MKLTKESELLMSFFLNNNCVQNNQQTNKTDKIFETLYHEIYNADSNDSVIILKPDITQIKSVRQIPKPLGYNSDSFPEQIRHYIEQNILYQLTYNFTISKKPIEILMLVEDRFIMRNLEKYNSYAYYCSLWLKIAYKYTSRLCANTMKIFLFLVHQNKNLPNSNLYTLNTYNVNTAYTTTCPIDSQIIVFRKEEWFKVFIHETFHNFAFDFSNMDTTKCHANIINLFPINSNVNAYEAYTEFWARILNVCFCSYNRLEDKTNIDEFLTNTELYMNLERNYAVFQMVKVLDFMGLNYRCLYEKSTLCTKMRQSLYKENTNVFAYYVLTLILLNNYQSFLNWCLTNNSILFVFKKTATNMSSFCKFIEQNYKSKTLLQNVDCFTGLVSAFKSKKQLTKDIKFLKNNLRMTICELG